MRLIWACVVREKNRWWILSVYDDLSRFSPTEIVDCNGYRSVVYAIFPGRPWLTPRHILFLIFWLSVTIREKESLLFDSLIPWSSRTIHLWPFQLDTFTSHFANFPPLTNQSQEGTQLPVKTPHVCPGTVYGVDVYQANLIWLCLPRIRWSH